MRTEISMLCVALGSLLCTAMLLVCLAVMTEKGAAATSETVNTVCLFAQRVLSLSVFAAFAADMLIHKKAR